MTGITLSAARALIAIAFLPWLALAAAMGLTDDELLWGPVPIINIKYWSAAMRLAGWKSTTLVHSYYAAINKREDFDVFHEDLVLAGSGRAGCEPTSVPTSRSSTHSGTRPLCTCRSQAALWVRRRSGNSKRASCDGQVFER